MSLSSLDLKWQLRIFDDLPVRDLESASRVCTHWKRLSKALNFVREHGYIPKIELKDWQVLHQRRVKFLENLRTGTFREVVFEIPLVPVIVRKLPFIDSSENLMMGRTMIAVSANHLFIYDAETGKMITHFTAKKYLSHLKAINESLFFVQAGDTLLFIDTEKKEVHWEINLYAAEPGQAQNKSAPQYYRNFLIEHDKLVILSDIGKVSVYNITTRRLQFLFNTSEFEIADFYLKGNFLLVRGKENTLVVCDITTRQRLYSIDDCKQIIPLNQPYFVRYDSEKPEEVSVHRIADGRIVKKYSIGHYLQFKFDKTLNSMNYLGSVSKEKPGVLLIRDLVTGRPIHEMTGTFDGDPRAQNSWSIFHDHVYLYKPNASKVEAIVDLLSQERFPIPENQYPMTVGILESDALTGGLSVNVDKTGPESDDTIRLHFWDHHKTQPISTIHLQETWKRVQQTGGKIITLSHPKAQVKTPKGNNSVQHLQRLTVRDYAFNLPST